LIFIKRKQRKFQRKHWEKSDILIDFFVFRFSLWLESAFLRFSPRSNSQKRGLLAGNVMMEQCENNTSERKASVVVDDDDDVLFVARTSTQTAVAIGVIYAGRGAQPAMSQ
jgi:hypothetical protein